jgi:hypothetical protein
MAIYPSFIGSTTSAYSNFIGSTNVTVNPNSQTRIVIMEKYVKPKYVIYTGSTDLSGIFNLHTQAIGFLNTGTGYSSIAVDTSECLIY